MKNLVSSQKQTTQEIVNYYKNQSIEELRKIKVLWAYGKNMAFRMRDLEGYSVFIVPLEDLIKEIDFGEMDRAKLNIDVLFGSSPASDYRIAQILRFWHRRKYMDLPEIGLNFSYNTKRLSCGDGRHRLITALHLGEKKVPIAVPDDQVQELAAIIELKVL